MFAKPSLRALDVDNIIKGKNRCWGNKQMIESVSRTSIMIADDITFNSFYLKVPHTSSLSL